MKFIKLTSPALDGAPMYVAVAHIVAFQPVPEGSIIFITQTTTEPDSGAVTVTESCDDILKLISKTL